VSAAAAIAQTGVAAWQQAIACLVIAAKLVGDGVSVLTR
jgi:hypothetical protein